MVAPLSPKFLPQAPLGQLASFRHPVSTTGLSPVPVGVEGGAGRSPVPVGSLGDEGLSPAVGSEGEVGVEGDGSG